MRDLFSNLKVTQAFAPAVVTSDQNGSAIDMRGYDSLMLIANVGTSGDTLSGSVKIEFEVEESDDNSTWNNVADADLLKVVTGTNPGTFALVDAPGEASQIYQTGYLGNKRYVRPVINLTGTHTNGTRISVTALQGHASFKPVNV